jgi:glycosyltransferase involved in cell wall biosynthesis
LSAWIVRQLTGIPYSFTVHAHDIYVHRAMLRRKVADADFIVAISEFNRRWVLDQCPDATGEKIHVVHCGVPVERYRKLRARIQQTDCGARLRILSVGALQPYKGHSTLLAACAQLVPRFALECRIVGGGPLRAQLEQQIARLNIGSSVTLLGPLDEDQVREELARADLFVLASIQEPSGKMDGIPVALIEAMAAGLPVVASRLSGIPELVDDGKTGLLANPGDASAFAHAIWHLRDPALREALASAAQLRVTQTFNLDRSLNQLIDLFEHRSALAEAVA